MEYRSTQQYNVYVKVPPYAQWPLETEVFMFPVYARDELEASRQAKHQAAVFYKEEGIHIKDTQPLRIEQS